jgi:hypothetical protein
VSTLEARLREVLSQLAGSDPPPPAGISIAGAIRRGHSRLRWRRARLAAPPVLAASAVLAVALAGPLTAGAAGPAHQPVAATQQRAAVAAPRQLSALVPYASFGWLPPGEALRSGGNGPVSDYLNAYAGTHFKWQLTTFAGDACRLTEKRTMLTCSLGGQAYGLGGRAPAVSGHRAFWVSFPRSPQGRQHQAVVWQYAPNGWAELGSATGARQAPTSLLRIASTVSFGGSNRPVMFAAQLTKVPASWRVAIDSFEVANRRLLATEATFAANGSESDDLPFVTTSTAHSACYFYPGGQSVRRMINGYRIVVNTIRDADSRRATYQVCAPDVNGLFLFISVDGLRPVITPVTLFRHLRALGTNPANWSAAPTG